MQLPIAVARVKFILTNGVTQETVVRDFDYNHDTNKYTWKEHSAYPMFIPLQTGCISAIVILEVFDQQPCDE